MREHPYDGYWVTAPAVTGRSIIHAAPYANGPVTKTRAPGKWLGPVEDASLCSEAEFGWERGR
jgi:hypothetical protein